MNDSYRPRSDARFVRDVVACALDFVDARDRDVSLLLTDDREIARLHARYLDDPTPTDVMSFLVDDTIEVVVNVERARREARRYGHTIRAELALYIAHGILHACGYDDTGPRERRRMRRAERTILERLGQRPRPVDAE